MGRNANGSTSRPPGGAQPVQGGTVTSSIPRLPWLIGGAIVLAVLIGGFLLLRPGGSGTGAAVPSGSASAKPGGSAGATAGAGSSAGASSGGSPAAGTCPTSQPPPLPAGETRTVTMTTPKGDMVLTIEADLSPIAAGNFVALSSCGFYDGTVFHRTPTLQDGTPFVIQGGDGQFGKVDSLDPQQVGTGGPGYTIKDEPVTTPYKRGTVAMARSAAPDSVGSQFFIVLDDKDGAILGGPGANNYQIIGNVTSGMDVADAIYTASGGAELPPNPIPITTVTVANP